MKKKLQKYLSGSNEGFSLVELIIVIAIMAILIGVVALAVIPYLEKSRESKDLQALSSLSGALSTAVADVKATGSGTITYANGTTVGSGTAADGAGTTAGTTAKVVAAMQDALGNTAIELSSTGGAAGGVVCYYDTSNNTIAVYVPVSTQPSGYSGTPPTVNGTTVQVCKYNDNAPLMVSNGGSGTTTTTGGGTGSGT